MARETVVVRQSVIIIEFPYNRAAGIYQQQSVVGAHPQLRLPVVLYSSDLVLGRRSIRPELCQFSEVSGGSPGSATQTSPWLPQQMEVISLSGRLNGFHAS